MNWWTNPLVILIAFPLAGAALIALIGSRQTRLIRWLALAVTLIEFGLSLWLSLEQGRLLDAIGKVLTLPKRGTSRVSSFTKRERTNRESFPKKAKS